MCILSMIPAGIELTDTATESLFNGGISNPHGHGWAIASPNDGFLVMGRGLSLDETMETFIKARIRYPNGPALFHSRWATHGSVRIGNCHPFMVGNSHRTVLAHNGILPKSAHPMPGDDRSDTAIMAADILPRQFRRLDKPSVNKALTDYCGYGNKLVLLTVESRYRENVYVINETAGQWDGTTGIWHSNSDYQIPAWNYPATNTRVQWWEESDLIDPTACYFCNQRTNDYGICTTCGTCQDCYESESDCLCFTPADSAMAR